MSAQFGQKVWKLPLSTAMQLFQRVGDEISSAREVKSLLAACANSIRATLEADRCVFLLVDDETKQSDDEECRLVLAAEHASGDSGSGSDTSERHYQINLNLNSELYRLLLSGKPLPLKDIRTAESSSVVISEFDRFVKESGSKSVVAFPMVSGNQLIGCMSIHFFKEGRTFPEELLELGETLAQQLGAGIRSCRALKEHDLDGRMYKEMTVPALILDRGTARIAKCNEAAGKVLAGTRKDLQGLPITQVIPDGQRLITAARDLSQANPSLAVPDVLVGSQEGRPWHMDVCLSLLSLEGRDFLLLLILPGGAAATGSPKTESGEQPIDWGRVQRAEDLASNLSRQISWERWVRQIVCKLHSTLDRDTLLQTVVDGFGRALSASRCLIVRTDGPGTPLVTHEYAEPDISPLGLGRTGQFPATAISYFRHKVAAVTDLSVVERSGDLTAQEYEYFVDNGIRSMAGAPLTSHGITYGVIIILESGVGRKWLPHELDMLEITANQTAVALGHSQSFLQLKDQLFNMNLLGNLTQQLTNTLELVSRSGKPEEEKSRQLGSSPPLSLRELEVLKLIAAGLANREIAQRLFLTESTVELHASRIRKKLKLKSRTALVKYACDNGLA